MGERVNGIHEVRGSIPLASMRTGDWEFCPAPQLLTARPADRPTGTGSGGPWVGLDWRCAGIAQLVEHNLAKVGVAGSSPVSRSRGSAEA